ncbi:MAG TPA: sulfurtransferase TusA family protein [Bacillota bacterium]
MSDRQARRGTKDVHGRPDQPAGPDLERARAELDRLNRPAQVAGDGGFAAAGAGGPAVDPGLITVDRELDVTGEVCPYPVDAALSALATMQPGQVLAEWTDHTIATHTVPAAVQRTGMARVLAIEERGRGLYRILLQRI